MSKTAHTGITSCVLFIFFSKPTTLPGLPKWQCCNSIWKGINKSRGKRQAVVKGAWSTNCSMQSHLWGCQIPHAEVLGGRAVRKLYFLSQWHKYIHAIYHAHTHTYAEIQIHIKTDTCEACLESQQVFIIMVVNTKRRKGKALDLTAASLGWPQLYTIYKSRFCIVRILFLTCSLHTASRR